MIFSPVANFGQTPSTNQTEKGSLTNFVISYHLGFFFNKETFNVVEDFSFVLFRIEFLGEYVNVEHLKLRLQHEFVVVDADESNGV